MSELSANPFIGEIKTLLENARANVVTQINSELISTYWHIGEIIVNC